LVFSLFTRLGVSRRGAWGWLWVVPTAYAFVLQAGSIGNDLFGAVLAMAAVDFSFRARVSRRGGGGWLSCIAGPPLAGRKSSNLPLLLPWAIAIFPTIPLLLKKPIATFAVAIFAATASLLPIAIINMKHCGDWSGLAAERAQFGKGSPV